MRFYGADMPAERAAALAVVREQMLAVEAHRRNGKTGAMSTGWGAIDRALPEGGLRLGAVHELIGLCPPEGAVALRWSPPLSVLVHLAARSVRGTPRRVAWIGRSVWPSLHALAAAGEGGFADRSLLIDAPDAPTRWWAIDASLRAAGVVVVADGTGMDLAASRRLQLAAEAGGSLGLVTRPHAEANAISAAWSRWVVQRVRGGQSKPRWSIRLARRKGVPAPSLSDRRFVLELADGRVVDVSADVRRGLGAAAATA